MPSPLDQLKAVVDAVKVPVQAVGGLTLEQAVRTPEYGAPLVVIGAPLALLLPTVGLALAGLGLVLVAVDRLLLA